MKNIVLKASAGTGKTYRLSLEYIISLSEGVDFKDILVMTFTRKATAELKERVLTFLRDICTSEEKRGEFEENISDMYGKDFKFDLENMKKIYRNISENRDKIKIFTIDAFVNLIFKRAIAPFLKIYNYEIKTSDSDNYDILTKTFEKLFEDKKTFEVFKDFLSDNAEKNMENYIDIIGEILKYRWKFILIGDKIYKEKEKFEHRDIEVMLEDVLSTVLKMGELRGKSGEECLKKKFLPLLDGGDNGKFLRENYSLFLKDNILNGVKIRKNKKFPKVNDMLDEYLEYTYPEFLEHLCRERYNNLVLPYEKKIIKTLKTVYNIYDEIKFSEKKFTTNDLSNYVFKYLGNEELGFFENGQLTDDFFELLDGKVNTIFIDEFQDTSILQWKILKNIIDRCENVICVGDEKQSIYGWRDGEKKLFENLDSIIGSEVEILEKCYRSRENIINYVNTLFEDIDPRWHYSKVNFVENEKKGFVDSFIGNEEFGGTDKICNEIRLKFKDNYDGVGVIARKKKELEQIGDTLSKMDIPYTYETNTTIVDTDIGNILYDTLLWLVNGDYLAFLNVLRSEVVNISANHLKELIERRDEVENFIYTEDDTSNFESIKVLRKMKDIYRLYFENFGESSAIVYEIIRKLGILEHFTSKDDGDDIYSFYRLLKRYKYLSDFLEDYQENPFDSKFQKSFDSNTGVKLLTIHKSKGLEFDTVFYYIGKTTKTPNPKGIQIFFKVNNMYNEIEDYLITDAKYLKLLENIEDLTYLEEKREKEELEEINNLYVALTRPKKNLYVVMEDESSYNSLGKSKVMTNGSIGTLELEEKLLEESLENGENLDIEVDISAPEKDFKVSNDENIENGRNKIRTHNLAIENRRIRGSVIHYLLENIEIWNEENVARAKEMVIAKYTSLLGERELFEILSPKNLEYIRLQCQSLFSYDWDFIHNEYVVYFDKKEYRIDRLMIKKPSVDERGIIFIADYKTGQYSPEQLENYKKIVSEELYKNHINLNEFDIITKYIEINL